MELRVGRFAQAGERIVARVIEHAQRRRFTSPRFVAGIDHLHVHIVAGMKVVRQTVYQRCGQELDAAQRLQIDARTVAGQTAAGRALGARFVGTIIAVVCANSDQQQDHSGQQH